MSGAGYVAPCEHRNASWPSACGKPSKALAYYFVGMPSKRLCGIHANSWERAGWRIDRD